ncbi:hypothetical protein B0H10DRAFT_1937744 [Mycena sp. CBHHK59/15]|nr:hypothetical protein B0H10DRAFT_1937744 [Mycena sp. CBHHK59/15]
MRWEGHRACASECTAVAYAEQYPNPPSLCPDSSVVLGRLTVAVIPALRPHSFSTSASRVCAEAGSQSPSYPATTHVSSTIHRSAHAASPRDPPQQPRSFPTSASQACLLSMRWIADDSTEVY